MSADSESATKQAYVVFLADGLWHQWVGTWSGTRTALYKDGILVDVGDADDTWTNNTLIYMMSDGDTGDTRFLKGVLDEVRIYNRVLSATEISEHYQGIFRNESGLVGLWHFSEGAGTTTADSSDNGNTGTLQPTGSEPTWTFNPPKVIGSGTQKYCLSFDGSNDYVDTGLTSNTTFSNATFSVEGWFKTSLTTLEGIMGKTTGSSDAGFAIIITSNKFSLLFRQSGTGNTVVTRLSSSSVNDGVWHHFVVIATEDETTLANNVINIYIDGVLNQGALTQTALPASSATSVKIGVRGDSLSYFSGLIDDVRIYSRALSVDEVLASYKGQTVDSTGLVGWWKMDEGTGTTTADSSGNGNTGTLQPTGSEPAWTVRPTTVIH